MKKYKILGVTINDAYYSNVDHIKKLRDKELDENKIATFHKWEDGTYSGRIDGYSYLELIIVEIK